jgi:hypothetical protein
MGYVPDKARHEMTVGAQNRFSALDRTFCHQKAAAKSLYQVHLRHLHQKIDGLRWSDPSLEIASVIRWSGTEIGPGNHHGGRPPTELDKLRYLVNIAAKSDLSEGVVR